MKHHCRETVSGARQGFRQTVGAVGNETAGLQRLADGLRKAVAAQIPLAAWHYLWSRESPPRRKLSAAPSFVYVARGGYARLGVAESHPKLVESKRKADQPQ